jgi:hypothetical protein
MKSVAHIILGLALSLATTAWGQEIPQAADPDGSTKRMAEPSVFEVAKLCQFNRIEWELAVGSADKDYRPVDKSRFISTVKADELAAAGLTPEDAARVASALPGYCAETIMYYAAKPLGPALAVGSLDGKRCAIVTNIMFTTVFNTLRTSAQERATSVATSVALPHILSLAESLKDHGFTCFGACVSFGSRNFVDHSDVLNTKGEVVVVAIPVQALTRLQSGEITEEEAIAQGVAFGADRNGDEIRRVRLGSSGR